MSAASSDSANVAEVADPVSVAPVVVPVAVPVSAAAAVPVAAPVVAPVVAADGTVTEPVAGEPGAPELEKNVSSFVDEFEIQEDEIMQFKSAQENEQMKKDFEKKIEVLNSKLKFAEIELEKVLAFRELGFISISL